jgi:dihydrofolate synthase/folylpolyglutamate synthase
MLKPGSELWLDGGHNPAAGRALAQTLADLEERAPKPVYLIVGMMGLKDSDGFLSPFRGLVRRVLTVPIPRAYEAPHAPEELAATARSVGLEAECSSDIESALQRIDQLEPGAKRILICGSIYLAGNVLALQDGVEPQAN